MNRNKWGSLTRQRLPTGEGERVLIWKDLNVGIDLAVYGKKLRLYDCDSFTREYLTSQGIEVNQAETSPKDIYRNSRIHPIQNYTTPTDMDKLGKFLRFIYTMSKDILGLIFIKMEKQFNGKDVVIFKR